MAAMITVSGVAGLNTALYRQTLCGASQVSWVSYPGSRTTRMIFCRVLRSRPGVMAACGAKPWRARYRSRWGAGGCCWSPQPPPRRAGLRALLPRACVECPPLGAADRALPEAARRGG